MFEKTKSDLLVLKPNKWFVRDQGVDHFAERREFQDIY